MFKLSIKYLVCAIFFNLFLLTSEIQAQRFMVVTFDDLPLNTKSLQDGKQWIEQTKKLLASIKKYNIPAIGFVNEYKLYVNDVLDSARLEALQLWVSDDLELGNHTFSHHDYHNTDEYTFFEDILEGDKITNNMLLLKNKKLEYFRHPYLHTGTSLEKKKALEDFLKDHEYLIAPVTIDNGEWIYARAYENACNKNDTELMKQIGTDYINYMIAKTAYFENQSLKLFGREIMQILLLHSNMLNADYLDEVVEKLLERNYQFISIKEAIKDPAYKSEDTYTGKGGISWLHRWSYTKKVDKSFFAGEPEVPQNILDLAGIESE